MYEINCCLKASLQPKVSIFLTEFMCSGGKQFTHKINTSFDFANHQK